MKALGYLKALEIENSIFPCRIDEAIAELEALQAKLDEYEEYYIHRHEAQRITNENIGDMLKHVQALQEKVEYYKEKIVYWKHEYHKAIEPKTCDGCIYNECNNCTHWSARQEDCCIRFNNPTDFYEPKGKQ